jgi:hypothetical protein
MLPRRAQLHDGAGAGGPRAAVPSQSCSSRDARASYSRLPPHPLSLSLAAPPAVVGHYWVYYKSHS